METKTTEKKTIEPTTKQKDAVKQYISMRFGSHGVSEHGWKRSIGTRSYEMKKNITPENLGIFRHALSECTIEINLWPVSDIEDGYLGEVHLYYRHINSGSNGCKIDLRFTVDKNAVVKEIY